jgi:hypothetical protein
VVFTWTALAGSTKIVAMREREGKNSDKAETKVENRHDVFGMRNPGCVSSTREGGVVGEA